MERYMFDFTMFMIGLSSLVLSGVVKRVKVVRICRLARLCRTARMFRAIQPLWNLLRCMRSGLPSLLCAFFLMSLLLFSFAQSHPLVL